ncbi:hypothetical protein [Hyperthermus butylicus]|uniref:hypothetical protein n=1 Tax=Hyperthermus butylicus TaxID=54248 RepID=UPI001E5977A6|nr:hypothetical protein [Hyperthermus butylicus]
MPLARLAGYAYYHIVSENCRSGGEPVDSMAISGPSVHLEAIREGVSIVRQGKVDVVAVTDRDGHYVGSITLREALEEYDPATN